MKKKNGAKKIDGGASLNVSSNSVGKRRKSKRKFFEEKNHDQCHAFDEETQRRCTRPTTKFTSRCEKHKNSADQFGLQYDEKILQPLKINACENPDIWTLYNIPQKVQTNLSIDDSKLNESTKDSSPTFIFNNFPSFDDDTLKNNFNFNRESSDNNSNNLNEEPTGNFSSANPSTGNPENIMLKNDDNNDDDKIKQAMNKFYSFIENYNIDETIENSEKKFTQVKENYKRKCLYMMNAIEQMSVNFHDKLIDLISALQEIAVKGKVKFINIKRNPNDEINEIKNEFVSFIEGKISELKSNGMQCKQMIFEILEKQIKILKKLAEISTFFTQQQDSDAHAILDLDHYIILSDERCKNDEQLQNVINLIKITPLIF